MVNITAHKSNLYDKHGEGMTVLAVTVGYVSTAYSSV